MLYIKTKINVFFIIKIGFDIEEACVGGLKLFSFHYSMCFVMQIILSHVYS